MAVVPAPTMQQPDIGPRGVSAVPFRRAAPERVEILGSENGTITANIQRFDRTIEGSGYLFGIFLRLAVTTAGNAAGVTFHEDSPFRAFDSVVLRDVNGELVNINGYALYISQLVNRQFAVRNFADGLLVAGVSGSTYLHNLVTGAGATGGSFTACLRVPVATNRRDLLGLLGNQDRAQKYQLRTDIAPSANIYGVVPTTAGTFVLEKLYENYGVPNAQTPQGIPQEIFPNGYGTIHYTTSHVAEAIPVASSTVNHFLKRLGNTVRWIALIFRANGSRATAEANRPTSIRFKIGEDTLFNETYEYRRALMFERFGFDFPNGVLVYDAMHDFAAAAGFEMGDDYFNTQAIVNAQMQIAYPAGFAAPGSLEIITDDLQLVGAPVR